MTQPVVLITGCSSGIGRDLAEGLDARGYAVVATARHPERLAGLPAALKLSLDVERPESIAAAVEQTVDRFGRIDVLINNAGYGQFGALEDLSDEHLHQILEVNFHGPIRLIRAVTPHMRRQGSGRIINLSSVAGRGSFPMWGAYCASKHALEAASDALRLELKPFGIHVVVVEPGAIRTGFEAAATARGATGSLPVYRSMYQATLERLAELNRAAPGPEAVTATVLKALQARAPRPRYQVTLQAVLAVRALALLGDGLKDRLAAGWWLKGKA